MLRLAPLTINRIFIGVVRGFNNRGASYPMVIYQSLVNTFVTPVIERHKAEGARAQNELWQAWLLRKQQADTQGLAFNEPPPGADRNSNE